MKSKLDKADEESAQASFMISNLFDRQRELHERCTVEVDPFVLLKEVSEMSRLYREAKEKPDAHQE